MTARLWHGVTDAEKSGEYLHCLNETGVPDYRATEGNRGVYVLRRIGRDRAHFLTVPFWGSMQKIEAFPGPEPGKARYYPEDEEVLPEFEPGVEHHGVVAEP